MGRSRELLLVSTLLFVSWGVQYFVTATRRIPTNSDQAIVGLMAKHIAEGKGHPVFYYGATYAGSVEPHAVAVLFSIFEPSPKAYRGAMALLVTLTMLGVYALTRWRFGVPAAAFALAYLAIPPFFFLYKGLTSDGHYNAFNLFTLFAVLAALRVDGDLRTGRGGWIGLAALGAVIGVGWWINPITPSVSFAALLWLVARRAPRPGPGSLVPLVGGAIVGSAPWWIWNLRHGWASLKAAELGTVGIPQAMRNLVGFFTTSLPTLAGGMEPNTIPRFAQETFPGSRWVALVAVVLLLATSVVRAFRGDRDRALLLLILAALLAGASFSQRSVVSEPRFLFPYYVVVPPLIGAALAGLLESRKRLLLAGACGLLLCLHVANVVRGRVSFRNVDGEVTGSLDSVIRLSEQRGIRTAYADYWTAYRLSFESGEKIVSTPIPGEEPVRHVPYQEVVARDPSAGIALLPPRSDCFQRYLRERNLPFAHFEADGFQVFFSLPPTVLDFIRTLGALPLPADAYRVSWEIGAHPPTVGRTAPTTARVAFRNVGPCPWPQAVHLGYHWKPLDAGLPDVFDGGRALPNRRIAPGERVELDVFLKAPAESGRYLLQYDLVFELVDWFSTRGGPMKEIAVTVR